MKHLFVLIALCLIVGSASASFTQNFQDTTGYTGCIAGGGTCAWVKNLTGGNSYITTSLSTTYINNTVPEQTSYFAMTTESAFTAFQLFDSSMNLLYSSNYVTGGAPGRYEMRMEGDSKAHFYVNGVNTQTSGVLALNPSYVAVSSQIASSGYVDDIVYGASAQKVVYGMPEENVFIIKKDMINPASSGVAFKTNGTIVSSTLLATTWSKSAIGATGGANDSIYLANVFSGTVYDTKYTGIKNTSPEYWDIQTALINSGAPYGWYEIYIANESGAHSIPINYIGTGASVSFDKDSYSQQDTATITHSVDNGGYWDTGSFNYKLAIMNGNTGQFVHNESILVQSGTSTYTFTSSDTQGTYYAIVIATSLTTGEEIWMNFDWASVSAYATFTGYVNGAETNAVLSGANVSIVQGSTIVNQVTTADGNYTATGFLTGATLAINVTASGYSQYYVTLVPMVAKSIPLNFTLNSTTPTFTGLGIGGVNRDGNITGTLVTLGYGNPIGSATDYLQNMTYGDYCTNTSNMAGWYLFDEGNGCMLTSGRLYNVWGSKAGYSNSTVYMVVAA